MVADHLWLHHTRAALLGQCAFNMAIVEAADWLLTIHFYCSACSGQLRAAQACLGGMLMAAEIRLWIALLLELVVWRPRTMESMY